MKSDWLRGDLEAVENSKLSPVTAGYVCAGVMLGAFQGILRTFQRQTLHSKKPERFSTHSNLRLARRARKSLLNIVVVGTAEQAWSDEEFCTSSLGIFGQVSASGELVILEEIIDDAPITVAVWCVGSHDLTSLGCDFLDCSNAIIVLYDPLCHPLKFLEYWSKFCYSVKKPFAIMACNGSDKDATCTENVSLVDRWCQDNYSVPHFVRQGQRDIQTCHLAVRTLARQVLASTIQAYPACGDKAEEQAAT